MHASLPIYFRAQAIPKVPLPQFLTLYKSADKQGIFDIFIEIRR